MARDFTVDRKGNIFIITLQRAPENRLNMKMCQDLIQAFRDIQKELGRGAPGAVITRGQDAKFFSTGLDLEEGNVNPFAQTDGFFPLLHTLLDFPYPTIACITGHTFGGACPFSLAHDYRVMNSERGFFCMPPVDLGLHFPGIGALAQAKLGGRVARKILLEAHRFTGKEALAEGIVDAIAPPDQLMNHAMKLAETWQHKAKAGVYALLRQETVKDAVQHFRSISHVHSDNKLGVATKSKI